MPLSKDGSDCASVPSGAMLQIKLNRVYATLA